MNTSEIFARRLKQARLEAGLTQIQLGKRALTCGKMISDYELGLHVASLETLVFLAKTLNVSTDWLLGLK